MASITSISTPCNGIGSPMLTIALGSSEPISEGRFCRLQAHILFQSLCSTVHMDCKDSDMAFNQELIYLPETKALLSRKMNKSLSTFGMTFSCLEQTNKHSTTLCKQVLQGHYIISLPAADRTARTTSFCLARPGEELLTFCNQ